MTNLEAVSHVETLEYRNSTLQYTRKDSVLRKNGHSRNRQYDAADEEEQLKIWMATWRYLSGHFIANVLRWNGLENYGALK